MNDAGVRIFPPRRSTVGSRAARPYIKVATKCLHIFFETFYYFLLAAFFRSAVRLLTPEVRAAVALLCVHIGSLTLRSIDGRICRPFLLALGH